MNIKLTGLFVSLLTLSSVSYAKSNLECAMLLSGPDIGAFLETGTTPELRERLTSYKLADHFAHHGSHLLDSIEEIILEDGVEAIPPEYLILGAHEELFGEDAISHMREVADVPSSVVRRYQRLEKQVQEKAQLLKAQISPSTLGTLHKLYSGSNGLEKYIDNLENIRVGMDPTMTRIYEPVFAVTSLIALGLVDLRFLTTDLLEILVEQLDPIIVEKLYSRSQDSDVLYAAVTSLQNQTAVFAGRSLTVYPKVSDALNGQTQIQVQAKLLELRERAIELLEFRRTHQAMLSEIRGK